MIQSHDHHQKDHVCLTRPPYRNGRKLRAVKVYTIAQESKYLIVQNVPAIAGVMEQLIPYFKQYGSIEQSRKLEDYEKKTGEEFVETVMIKFMQIHQARVAKCKLDDLNFMGSILHICYAPECETLDELREKLAERRTIVARRSHLIKGKKRLMKSTEQTSNEIRIKMRDIVQKSNLISLVLEQEMRIFLFIFLLAIALTQSRLRDDEVYHLEELLTGKHNRHPHRQEYEQENEDDDDDDDQYIPSSFDHRKVYSSRKNVLPNDEYPVIEKSDPSTCLDNYQLQSEQLVKVSELKNGAHLISHILLDKRTLPSHLNIKEHCMLNCCSRKPCDLAMLSEKPSHEGYRCYLYACNGSCTLVPHQDYTIMMSKSDSTVNQKSEVTTTITSTSTIVHPSTKKSFFRETSVIIFLIFGVISTIVLFVFLAVHYRDCPKRGLRSKNYTVDADYLINGLYL